MQHTVGVTRKNRVTFDGREVGTVVRIGHNIYSAQSDDGSAFIAGAYGNGGAKYVAAHHLVTRLGLLRSGDEYIDVDHRGERIHGGPWTVAATREP